MRVDVVIALSGGALRVRVRALFTEQSHRDQVVRWVSPHRLVHAHPIGAQTVAFHQLTKLFAGEESSSVALPAPELVLLRDAAEWHWDRVEPLPVLSDGDGSGVDCRAIFELPDSETGHALASRLSRLAADPGFTFDGLMILLTQMAWEQAFHRLMAPEAAPPVLAAGSG